MEQHPIPQNVTTYKFHLVGNMTLKQFGELAIGVVGAWLILSSSLGFLIKWTLGPTLGFLGFALAFLPIEDRPLDQWILNFFKSIYRNTQFIYQTKAKDLDIFSQTPLKRTSNRVSPQTSDQLDEYLKTLPPSPTTQFDIAEGKYLEHIRNLFGALGTKLPKDTFVKDHSHHRSPKPIISGVKGLRIRKLQTPQMCLLPHTATKDPVESIVAAMPVPSDPLPISKPSLVKTVSKSALKPTKATTPQVVKPAIKPAAQKTVKPVSIPKASISQKPVTAATFATTGSMPLSPEKPNLISGITLDKDGKIISNAILEIKDSSQHPVRALKSNKLGQFFIATPLSDGIYQIEIEHQDHRFAIIKLEVKGEIIPPLKIQALK